MLNIIIPIFEPKNLDTGSIDFLKNIKNKSIFAWSLDHLEKLNLEKRYFIVSTDKFISSTHIDKIISLYTSSEVQLIRLSKNTMGAPCAVLMGIDNYKLDEEFLITSPDQFIDIDLNYHLNLFKEKNAVAGTVGFNSINSKWSYGEINNESYINRIVEKIPISNNALTSTYYFKNGNYMVDAFSDYILRGELTNDKYYIAPSLNELIIKNHNVFYSKIASEKYFNFFSEDVKQNFLNYINQKEDKIIHFSREYFNCLKNQDYLKLKLLLSSDVNITLLNEESFEGFNLNLNYGNNKEYGLIEGNYLLENIFKIDDQSTYCNYILILNSKKYEIIEKISFDNITSKIQVIKRFINVAN